VDGHALTAEVVTPPTNGMLVLAAGGAFTYTPAPDFFGMDTFTYRVRDELDGSVTATVTITVTSVDEPPNPDAGVGMMDAGMMDAGMMDAGMGTDAGMVTTDAGMVTTDTGVGTMDAGMVMMDAGMGTMDAGMGTDSGTVTMDAGVTTPDGGGIRDSGVQPPPAGGGGGCSASSPSGPRGVVAGAPLAGPPRTCPEGVARAPRLRSVRRPGTHCVPPAPRAALSARLGANPRSRAEPGPLWHPCWWVEP
jgi:hypothetical protein